MITWIAIMWGLTGPIVVGAFSNEDICNAVIDELEKPAVRFCAPMRVDNLVSDVVLYKDRVTRLTIKEKSGG
jgi:hypothetical protein